MTVVSEVTPGSLQAYIIYSADVLEYIGDVSIIAGGEGILRLTDSNIASARNETKYVLRFRAVGRGSASLSLRDNIELYELEEGYLMSVSSNSLIIGVDAAQTASGDTTLALLKISPGTLKPKFSAGEYEYNTTVPYDTEQLFVSARPTDSEAAISVSGENLSVGQNRVVITVTAENGTTGKYVIYCVREAEPQDSSSQTLPDNNVADNTEAENNIDNNDAVPSQTTDNGSAGNTEAVQNSATQNVSENHWRFYAQKADERTFIIADTCYEVAEKPDSLEIPAGYIKTSIIISGNKLVAYAPADKTDGDFLLLVLKCHDSEAALYRYDRKEKTIQRYTGNTETIVNPGEASDALENKELKESYEKSLGTMTLIIAVLSGISMVLLIVVIRFAIKAGRDDEE